MTTRHIQLTGRLAGLADNGVTQAYLDMLAGVIEDARCSVHGGSAANIDFVRDASGRELARASGCCRAYEELLLDRVELANGP